MAPAGAAARIASAVAGRIVVDLTQSAADLITTFSAGAKLYLDSATSETGTYANVTSTALVSGTGQYEFSSLLGSSTTWYKVRVGNTGGTAYSDYSDPVQNTSLLAYATLDDLFATMSLPDATRYDLLSSLLIRGREVIDAACGRTFMRVPQVSGTVTVYADVRYAGRSSLVSAIGKPYFADGRALDIVSITTLSVRDDESDSTYTTIAAGDTGYYLGDGTGPGEAGVDWPHEDVILSPNGTDYTTWPVGRRAAKFVCVPGFPRIPSLAWLANLDLARGWYDGISGNANQPAGINQFGTPILLTGDPPSFRALTAPGSPYRKHSWASV